MAASFAHGQVATGSLFGEIRDESGSVVSAARVVAEQETTGFTRTAVTDESGAYRIEPLAPGTYSVRAQRTGFQTAVTPHVTLEVNQQARVDVRLKIGEMKDSVSVAAAVSPLATEDATAGSRVDSQTLTELPLDDRDVAGLITLGPGAIPRQLSGFVHDAGNDIQQGTRGSVALNAPINGGRPYMNGYFLDGAYDTDQNTYAIVVLPPMDSVQEFRIQSSLASAVFAQAGGGVVDMVTKSGGQEFHGSAFEYLRNQATDARNYFDDPSLPAPPFRRNQFGGSLGGRLPLPKTFFFLAYEGVRGESETPSVQLVPDAQVRSGDFQGGNVIYDPLSSASSSGRIPFPNNAIPGTEIDPIARQYLAQYEPLPNTSGNAGNYIDSSPSSTNNDSVSARFDRQLSGGSLLFGRYTINDERGGVGGNFPLRPTTEDLRAQQVTLGHTMGGTSWSNELRASFTRLRLFDVPLSAGQQNVAAELGILNPPTDPFTFGLPYFYLPNYSTVTDDPTLPQIQRDNTWGVSETFSRVRGRRTYRFGFNWTHFQLNYRQSNTVRGEYVYSGGFTSNGSANSGDPLADFLLGYPQSDQRSAGDSQAYMRQNTYGGFAQQDWQVSSRLTLTLGLRYDYFAPFTEARDNLLNLYYFPGPDPPPPMLVHVGEAHDPNRTNFAPRAGLAWRIPGFLSSHGDTVFRAGWGIYYSPEISAESYDLVLNNIQNETNTADATTMPVLTTRNGFPSTSSAGFPSYYGLDNHLPTPYVQQWNAGFQHQLPGAVILDVSYIGSKGTDLGRFRRFNTALHTETGQDLSPRPGDLQSLRTWPSLGGIYQFENIANSSYNSLQVKAEKRLRRSLAFLASFVWSKSIDDSSTVIPGLTDGGGAQDENNLNLERGLSTFNVGRRISAGFVYNLPGGRSGRLLGGWQLSGIVTVQDGTPLDPLYVASDPTNAGTFTRPNVVLGQSISLPAGQRTPEHWFNTNAFSAPAPYSFGDAGRDIIPGPGIEMMDLALHKRFRISERFGIEARAEVFNSLNHPNFGYPDPFPDNGPFFGRILLSGEPRRMQFATRIDF